ncbi:MAG: hypothetical protein JNK05_04145 [Myxococcales bacterium]|nr:hypothetical protein [Myxococcales bacterium]
MKRPAPTLRVSFERPVARGGAWIVLAVLASSCAHEQDVSIAQPVRARARTQPRLRERQRESLSSPSCAIVPTGTLLTRSVIDSSSVSRRTRPREAIELSSVAIRSLDGLARYSTAIRALARAARHCLPALSTQAQWDEWEDNSSSFSLHIDTRGAVACAAPMAFDRVADPVFARCVCDAVAAQTLDATLFCSDAFVRFPSTGHDWVRRSPAAQPHGALPSAHIFMLRGGALAIDESVHALDWFERMWRQRGMTPPWAP